MVAGEDSVGNYYFIDEAFAKRCIALAPDRALALFVKTFVPSNTQSFTSEEGFFTWMFVKNGERAEFHCQAG